MTRWIGQWSLVSGPVPVVVVVLGVFAAAWLVLRGDRRHLTRTVPRLVLSAALMVGVLAFLVQRVWRPFPDPVPRSVYTWVGLGLLAVLLAVPRLRHGRGVSSRVLTVLAALTVVLTASSQVNLFFRAFPTVATALGDPPGHPVSFGSVRGREATLVTGAPLDRVWAAPATMPAAGVVSQVPIPGSVSGFAARHAEVYLPPAYLSTPRARLPVLVLLAEGPLEAVGCSLQTTTPISVGSPSPNPGCFRGGASSTKHCITGMRGDRGSGPTVPRGAARCGR